MDPRKIKQVMEAALLCADGPMKFDAIAALFQDEDFEGASVDRDLLHECLEAFAAECEHRGVELKKVASGYRLQIKQELSTWVSRMWGEKPPRYSRALLETLALVAYKQPVTRGDIEQVRGVAVSTNIMRTLIERNWVRVVGHREVPGRPAMYGTTRAFLDYFNVKSLAELPPLAEIRSLSDPLLQLDEEALPPPKASLEMPPEIEAEDAADESSNEHNDNGIEGSEGLEVEMPEQAEQKLAEVVVLSSAVGAVEE